MTTLLNSRDPKYNSPKADEALTKESKSLESRKWVKWVALISLDQSDDEKIAGTWSLAQMLTSEKHCEMGLSYEDCILKSRLVHCGNKAYCYHFLTERRENLCFLR